VGIARLHLITPDAVDASVPWRTQLALDAGAPWVQVRIKQATDRDRLGISQSIRDACVESRATCVIDDRADVALAVRAGGVHVGAEDLPVATVRAMLGPDAIVGGTCRNPDDARRAADDGASYVGVGPVYPTTTKSGLPDPIGLAGLEAVVAAVGLPVIAISGVTVERVAELLAIGVHGVAVVGAVFDAPDVADATRAFLEALGIGDAHRAADVPAGGRGFS
jgi:thiamine-phosphate pyrophosphorylase